MNFLNRMTKGSPEYGSYFSFIFDENKIQRILETKIGTFCPGGDYVSMVADLGKVVEFTRTLGRSGRYNAVTKRGNLTGSEGKQPHQRDQIELNVDVMKNLDQLLLMDAWFGIRKHEQMLPAIEATMIKVIKEPVYGRHHSPFQKVDIGLIKKDAFLYVPESEEARVKQFMIEDDFGLSLPILKRQTVNLFQYGKILAEMSPELKRT